MFDTIDANGRIYQIVRDLTLDWVAIAVARVFDEDGATPIDVIGVPSATDPRFIVLVKPGVLIVLMGDATILANPVPPFSLSLAVPGFRTVTVPVALPPVPVIPVTLPAVTLRRQPVSLGGRAIIAASGAPLAGAQLGFAPNPAIAGQTLIALGQALPADVPDNTALSGVPLAAVGGALPVKTVQADAPAGATCLSLDDRRDLASGQLLRIGPDDRPSLARIGVVAAAPADLTKPGLVLLSTPLTATARQGDPARAFTAGAAAGSTTVGQAFAGEALLLTPAVPAGDALIVGPPASGIPFTLAPPTDADGYYRQPGIARLPRLDLTMSAAGFTAKTIIWQPAAGTARIDWRMSP